VSALTSITPASEASPIVAAPLSAGFWRRFARRPAAVTALVVNLAIVLSCFGAAVLAPSGPNAADFLATSQGPSWAHLFGTDNLGRDVLSRMLYGGQHTLAAAALAVLTAAALGAPAGIVAGYMGGRWDRGIGWLTDGLLAMPAIILLLAVLAVFPHNLTATMIAFGILTAPGVSRVVRGSVLGIRSEQYIDAAKVSGIGDVGIMRRHVVSKIVGVLVVQVTILGAVAVLTESGLDFLGLGPQPPTATWGTMVAQASQVLGQEPWLLVPTGGMIAVFVLSLWFVGDGVRDAIAEGWVASATPPRRRRRSPRPTSALAEPSEPRVDAVLSLENLTVAFLDGDGVRTVVERVSLSVSRGETVALLGESGSGKSVTAAAAMGLLPANGLITEGAVRLGDASVSTSAPIRASMIFQEPLATLDPSLRVGRLLTDSLRRHRGLGRTEARKVAAELLAEVGINDADDVLRRFPHELSGGMAQRVGIARALTAEPELLIADEPTTALDVTVQAEVLDLLRDRQERTALAVLIITHDWGVVADVADRCVVMYAGQVVETASVEELFASPQHPYTQGLLAASVHGESRGRRLNALPGRVPTPEEWPRGCRFQNRCAYAVEACTAGPISLRAPAPERSSRCVRTPQHSELVEHA
jgi:peptide/nickel transport system permease protein